MKKTIETIAARNLRIWQTQNDCANPRLAGLIGVSVGHVSRWRSGSQRPGDEVRLKIQQITNGAVACGDWSIPYAPDQR